MSSVPNNSLAISQIRTRNRLDTTLLMHKGNHFFKIDNKISQNQALVLCFFPSAILKRRRTSDKCEEAENQQCSNYHSQTSYSYYYLLPGRHILPVRILNLQLRKLRDISKSLAKRDADLRGSIDRPSIGIKERGNVASAKLEPSHNHSRSRNT